MPLKQPDQLQNNIPLKNFTTLGIGGPAKYFFTAQTREKLLQALTFAQNNNLAFSVIGGGSNLLISDEGFPGIIIKNQAAGGSLADCLVTLQIGKCRS